MARKRLVFFHRVESLLKLSSSGRSWVTQFLLVLLTAFLCTVVSPVLAKSPVVNAVSSLLSNPAKTQSLVQQGRQFYEAGQFADAAAVWQQAASAFKTQGDVLNQAMVLSNLSLAYQQLGQWPQATQTITDSLQLLQARQNIASSIDQLQVFGQALNTQGHLQLALGQSEKALTTWQQAAATYTQAGNEAGVIGSLINQAQILQSSGLYRRAEKTLTQVNQTLQNQSDSVLKATGLRSLGNALRVVGDLSKSRQVLEQSRDVAKQSQSPPEISAALLSLGNTARTQGDTKAALEFYQQAATTSTSTITQIQAQLNQLSLLLETKQVSVAQVLWPQIQSKIDTLPPTRTAVNARINFAQSLMKLGSRGELSRGAGVQGCRGELCRSAGRFQFSSAPLPLCSSAPLPLCTSAQLLATAVQEARSIKDQRAEAYALGHLGGLYEQTQQWSNAQNLTQQALLLAQSINASDIAYRWQWQLGRLLKAQGNNQGAIAAYSEAVSTLQSLRRDLVAINPDIQFSFREEVEPVYRQLVDLLLQSQGTLQPSQKNLQKAREAIESLQLAELDNFFRAACLEAKRQIDQVVDQKDQTAAVIYPIILANKIEIILKLPQQQDLRHYATRLSQSQVEDTLQQLRQNLEEPYTTPQGKSLSQQVYDWLIRPAEADLAKSKVETLVFVLDGSLRNIPMAALYDGQQYLVQKYAVALTPSLQLLDPKPLERRQLKTLSAGLSEPRHGFPRLNYVESELEQIKSEVPSMVLLNQAFTSTALQNQINSLLFPVVHLATHGQFSSNADRTFILAWDRPINVNEFSDLLQSRDQSSSNAIELLVLSACETAAGDNRAALGLAGVSVRSGARSTLASLWNLDDETGTLLLSQFYRELAQTPLNKAEALRRAQLTLLKDPDYRHPSYWAPFVLVGNWL